MKNFVLCTLFAALILSVTACAKAKTNHETRVKCPACGYDFNIDRQDR